MRKFLQACEKAKLEHGILFRNFPVATRRHIVRYWMPYEVGEQLTLFG